MMKLLIVDDQWIILAGLKESISWERLGIDELYLAESAAQAKKIAEETEIDILITDIEMPVEGGIELSGWFRENYPEIPCIFLTAHADFSYAKDAIKNGGFDYILQPAKPKEIEQVIRRCMEHLEKVRKMRMLAQKGINYDEAHEKVLESLAKSLFEAPSSDMFHQEEWEREVNREHIYEWYLPALITVEAANFGGFKKLLGTLLEGKHPFICMDGRKTGHFYRYGVVICGIGMGWEEERILSLFQRLYNCMIMDYCGKIMIYVGKTEHKDLADMVMQLRKSQEDNVFLKEGVILVNEKRNGLKLREPNKEEWKQWMLKGDGQLIQNQIRNLLEYGENEKQLTLDYMKKLYDLFVDTWIICCYLKNVNGREWFDDPYPYEEFQRAFQTVRDFNAAVEFVIEKFNELLKQDTQEMAVSERIESVCAYINANLEKTVSRSEAAAMTYFSEDYFSKVFKEMTGYGFKEYGLIQKMEYCKRLLQETNYPVGVIAGKVGYDNFSNFSQIFKKYMGKTPQEYRSKGE